VKKNWIKKTAIVALAGTMFQFGGCSLNGILQGLLTTAPIYLGLEFLSDNDGIFDLFGDSAAAAE